MQAVCKVSILITDVTAWVSLCWGLLCSVCFEDEASVRTGLGGRRARKQERVWALRISRGLCRAHPWIPTELAWVGSSNCWKLLGESRRRPRLSRCAS